MMNEAALHFRFEGTPISCKEFGNGHINKSFSVETDTGARYVLQRINSVAFHDVPGLMENAIAVSKHIEEKATRENSTLIFVTTDKGENCYRDETGEYWRAYKYVGDCICLQMPESDDDFYQIAAAFGEFQNQLTDFPAQTLHETIPHFHDTPERYAQLKRAIEKDIAGRVSSVEKEISFALSREHEAGYLVDLLKNGELPLRVTHNDTKINNVLLDSKSRKALCVIDLDTVMPGLSAFDFGDAIRFGASTGAEDEKDLDKISIDLELFRVFSRGFIKACPGLTAKEKEVLPWGAKMMTLECGIRFLADYLSGDVYFSIDRPEHNLDRARTQFKLVEEMEKHWDEMCEIIKEESTEE